MKTFIKIIVIILCLFLVVSLFGIYKLRNSWKGHIENSELIRVTDIINRSEALPKEFYIVHDSLFPGLRKRSALTGMFKTIYNKHRLIQQNSKSKNSFSFYEYASPIFWAWNEFSDNNLVTTKNTSISTITWFPAAIEKYCSSEKCFDYFYRNHKFIYYGPKLEEHYSLGINNFSIDNLHKPIEKLSKKEIEKLLLIVANNTYFTYIFPDIY